MSTNIQVLPGKVGISNTSPIHTLDIGSNVYVDDTAENKLTVVGKIYTTDITVASNLQVMGTTTVVNTENLSIKDPIIELARDSVGTGDTGILMKRAVNESNVAIFYDEGVGFKIAHTMSGANGTHITVDAANTLPISLHGNVTVTSNLEVGTANLFVDTTTGFVGVGTVAPGAKLDVAGDVELNDRLTINSTVGNIKKKSFTNYNNNAAIRYWKVASGNYDGTPRNRVKMIVNIHRVDRLNITRRLVMGADIGALSFNPCIDEHDPNQSQDLRVYKNTSDTTFDIYLQLDSYTYVDVEMIYSGSGITVYDTPTWETVEPTTSETYLLEFTNGNLNAMKINNSGNVGIGTTSPSYKLDVHGTSNVGTLTATSGTFSGNVIFTDSGTTRRGIQGTVGGNDFWFVGGGATATNAGFMEIATGDDGAGEADPIYARQYSGTPLTGTVQRTLTLLDGSGNSSFPGTVAISSDLEVGTANLFVDTTTGNVGVGTSAPDMKLQVEGTSVSTQELVKFATYTVRHYSSNGGDDNTFKYIDADNQTFFDNRDNFLYVQIPAFSGETLYTHNINPRNAELFNGSLRDPDGVKPALPNVTVYTIHVYSKRVDSLGNITTRGNVGIGTTSPAYTLDVHGTSNVGALTATTATVPNDGDFVMGGKPLKPAAGLHWDRTNLRLGVGTTSPGEKLHVNGNLRLGSSSNNTVDDDNNREISTAGQLTIKSNDSGLNANYVNLGLQAGNVNPGQILIGGGSTDAFKTITFHTSGSSTERMRIHHDGNVGIGTTSPGAKLDVAGTGNFTGTVTAPTFSGNASTATTATNQSGGTVSATSGTFTGDVTTGSNVYVGTNTNDETSKSIYFGGTYGDNSYDHCVIERRVWETGSEKAELLLFSGNDNETAAGPDRIRLKGSNILFDTYATATIDRATATTKMIIKQDGNVGIGTASPGTKLDVAAQHGDVDIAMVHFRTNRDSNNNGDGSVLKLETGANRADVEIFECVSPAGSRFVVKAGGNVGIGTTSPATVLDVNGRGRFTGNGGSLQLVGTNHTYLEYYPDGTSAGRKAYVGYAAADDDNFTISNSAGSGHVILGGGNVGIGTTSPSYKLYVAGDIYATGDVIMFSDERKKTNIEVIPNALEKVLQLRGVTFEKLDDGNRRHSGIIAQEVEKVLPEVVYTAEDGTKSVAYGNMIGLLIEAIKELTGK
jgi:hypothetical protein